jgi:hypothetical protein
MNVTLPKLRRKSQPTAFTKLLDKRIVNLKQIAVTHTTQPQAEAVTQEFSKKNLST